jgi:hypothetical protein
MVRERGQEEVPTLEEILAEIGGELFTVMYERGTAASMSSSRLRFNRVY